jgi:Flp pilus assembly protein TadB
MKRRATEAQSAETVATMLPIAAAFLLLPPFILVFAAPVFVASVPLIVAYVFGLWAAVIGCAWFVARLHARTLETAGESLPETAAAETPERASGD